MSITMKLSQVDQVRYLQASEIEYGKLYWSHSAGRILIRIFVYDEKVRMAAIDNGLKSWTLDKDKTFLKLTEFTGVVTLHND